MTSAPITAAFIEALESVRGQLLKQDLSERRRRDVRGVIPKHDAHCTRKNTWKGELNVIPRGTGSVAKLVEK